MTNPTDNELKEIASEVNRCFDNGCGCCAGDNHNFEKAIKILRDLITESRTGLVER